MEYFIKRGEREWGPYSLAALQQYVAQGNISREDLARSEGMTDWVPVAQIVGNVVVAQPSSRSGAASPDAALATVELPPNLHWGVLLLLSFVTLGIFWVVWLIVQAVWVRKVRPQSKALFLLIIYFGLSFTAGLIGETYAATSLLLQLTSVVLYLIAVFSMRSHIEEYFNNEVPIGLDLSGVMTFFFNAVYFQYHFNKIRRSQEEAGVRAASA